jgi:hypothetical protein
MRFTTLAVVLATVAFALPAAAVSLPMGNGYGAKDAPRDIDPETLGQLFCKARMGGDMSPVEKFFAPKLIDSISNAQASDAEFRTAHPGDTSPLASGIPWQTVAATPNDCSIEILNGARDTIGVLVKISYSSPQGSWADTLNLVRTVDSWDIDNVFYDHGGNLRFKLLNLFDS